MKRNLITALIIQCCCIAVIAQKFSTKLYFLNKTGEKDTIEVGYDINATSGVDAEFGEVSYSTPLDSIKFKTFILTSGQESPSFLKNWIKCWVDRIRSDENCISLRIFTCNYKLG